MGLKKVKKITTEEVIPKNEKVQISLSLSSDTEKRSATSIHSSKSQHNLEKSDHNLENKLE